ncbi:polyprenyl synthetase family protein [Pyxidicoccus sp. MSG2]|uniref:polyprenyl synthetase family protein n=1 Tax=Pyxidicoccus sp. MSG2 TaxID=2996790 RepID=UPI00226DE902|nr:polyprenyl synthetase family protein [Pyxidicoccus sp. MSG2]MCY1020334.1 polyprenyl synthetase family protein [Pyxidicoccus sp. MSG2]
MGSAELLGYLEDCRVLALQEIQRIIPAEQREASPLYALMLDYPLREAKGLRPALCIASCRALGGKLDAVVRSAAVLELFHNAFLIHDDIEDGSLMRRGGPTLHRTHGLPIAVNVGDAMLALALQPLLDNVAVLGLGPALRILQAVARMTRESVEGQALELEWIRHGVLDVTDDDYVRMVEQKTAWYSFITPVTVGAITARAPQEHIDALAAFARSLGIAFQIQDDVLNLRGQESDYGKEIAGDLWEGKRTLMLLHMLRGASETERQEVARILRLPRPDEPGDASAEGPGAALAVMLSRLVEEGAVTPHGEARLREALRAHDARGPVKTEADVRLLLSLIERQGSLEHAQGVARQWAEDAERRLAACREWLPDSVHRRLLDSLVAYVLARIR